MTDTLLEGLIARALAAGADAADAMMADSVALSLTRRLGKPEGLERAEASDLGLRVFIGRRVAAVASSDRRPEALEALVERAIAMARAVPEDAEAGLADPAQIARGIGRAHV